MTADNMAMERAASRPPPIKTAAPIGQIGSGGEKEMEKLGGRSEEENYYTDQCNAIVPRIIATHFGLELGEVRR